MTPREHYERAEEILERAERQLNTGIELMQADPPLNISVGFIPEFLLVAAVHARLASVNLDEHNA